jgi:rhodanese-related sulfurtransferase
VLIVGALGWRLLQGPDGPEITPEELEERLKQDERLCILDVRSAGEFSAGHVPGARHIGHREIARRIGELTPYREQDIVVYCEYGIRAGAAIKALHAAGFTRILHLQGDMPAWRRAGRPSEI